MKIEFKSYSRVSDELIDLVCSLESKVFDEPYSREKITREASVKPGLYSLIAFSGGEPIGFKLGYEMTSRIFYSWNGGVVPEYREKGVASHLMDLQHAWAKEKGYRLVRTYTENKFKEMLILNIRKGFNITGVVNELGDSKVVIVLDKEV
ncbi:GNAT family N-acetyltransferase [Bremerella sp. T1]|uniref:GNAT family N-acetyltransferase n=1 Tax=Bremerella sp. TYQ1 TaxID=3119568 RepID=UPI001CCD64D3|nr:GNAT family N-acetyltransferase [Bremerella volcania]UBM38407.1 GNAT family N-acetyltransferase [Bremerella volcania]